MPRDSYDDMLVRTYVGFDVAEMVRSYWEDCRALAADGYDPITEVYVPGTWNWVDIFLAVITIPVLIGIFLTIRLLANRPTGSLVVTYARR